jgi:hypothetical protein
MADFVPPSRVYHFDEEDMTLYMTFTHSAERVKRWIRRVNEKGLNAPLKGRSLADAKSNSGDT